MTVPVRLVLLAAVALAALGASPSALAGGGCAQAVIDDWTDNARIDGTYGVNCYRSAIRALPEDLASYSSAADDIERALQARLREIAEREAADPTGDQGSGASGGSGGQEDGGGGDTEGAKESDERDTQQVEPRTDGSTSPAETSEPADAPSTDPVAAPSNEALESDLGDGGGSLPPAVIALLAVVGAAALATAGWLVARQVRRRRS